MPKSKPITVDVTVTQRDIDRGRAYDCYSCPLARAVKRRFPEAQAALAFTYGAEVYPTAKSSPLRASWPREAKNFMRAFDEHGASACTPTRFKLTFTR